MNGLYDKLMRLPEPFYFVDRKFDGATYRIFGYKRLGDPELWKLPGALECRGHMFEIDPMIGGVRLVSLPLPKFFNIGENDLSPASMDGHNFAMEKLDGSLISTFLHRGRLSLKSKMSLDGDQAVASLGWLSSEQAEELEHHTRDGWTISLEWTAPDNRIVVEYEEPGLVAICARNMTDGELRWAPRLETMRTVTVGSGADAFPLDEPGHEGIVLLWPDGRIAKRKTEWYRARHRMIAHVSDKHFAQVAITDDRDALSLLDDFPDLRARFEAVCDVCIGRINWMGGVVEAFHAEHGAGSRKEYALAAQALVGEERKLFPLLMQRFGGAVDLHVFALKHVEWLVIDELEPA